MCATRNVVWYVKRDLYVYIIIIIIIILVGVLLPLYGIFMVLFIDDFCILPEPGGGPVSRVIRSTPLPYSSDDRGTTVFTCPIIFVFYSLRVLGQVVSSYSDRIHSEPINLSFT